MENDPEPLPPTTPFALLGKYRTPKVQIGERKQDFVRGRVTIVGFSDALIPWPIGKRGRAKSLAVYGGLLEAIRRESNQAVCRHWGVTPQTVSKWRKALGVDIATEGTRQLMHDEFRFRSDWVRPLAWAKAADPERRAKIAASKRGKPRPPHVQEMLRRANLGGKASAETRQKMSAAHKARGTRPPKAGRPWTPEEDALLASLPPAVVVEKSGRTLQAVYLRRSLLRKLNEQ